jgi:hypothetical protein
MSNHNTDKGKSVTRGTTPIQFFEDTSGPCPPGTMAKPRPKDRPREILEENTLPDVSQPSKVEEASGAEGGKDMPRADGLAEASSE